MTTQRYKFPRICSISGEGMWDGYCFGDGQDYAIDKEGATTLAMQYGYDTLEEAFEDGAYYFTEWIEFDEDGWYESEHEDGRDAVWVDADKVTIINDSCRLKLPQLMELVSDHPEINVSVSGCEVTITIDWEEGREVITPDADGYYNCTNLIKYIESYE